MVRGWFVAGLLPMIFCVDSQGLTRGDALHPPRLIGSLA
jgi:hypothetical protein